MIDKHQKIDIFDLYQQVFGLGFMRIRPLRLTALEDKVDLTAMTLEGDAEPSSALKSFIGTPIHLPLTINGYLLPNEPLVTITMNKKIIETELDGNDGTFKEEFSLGDYDVNIKGILIDENNPDQLPESQIRQLRDVLETRGSVKVSNTLLSFFNIDRLAIYSCSFPEYAGSMEMVPYEITCKSDKEFDLELKDLGL